MVLQMRGEVCFPNWKHVPPRRERINQWVLQSIDKLLFHGWLQGLLGYGKRRSQLVFCKRAFGLCCKRCVFFCLADFVQILNKVKGYLSALLFFILLLLLRYLLSSSVVYSHNGITWQYGRLFFSLLDESAIPSSLNTFFIYLVSSSIIYKQGPDIHRSAHVSSIPAPKFPSKNIAINVH